MGLKNYQILIFAVLLTLFSCDEFNWNLKEKPLIEKVEIQAVEFTSCEVIVELKYIKSQKIGSEDVVELQFYSDTNDLAEKTLIKDNLTLGLNKFSISDLQASKHYFLKVVARNKVGETRSSFIYFQTLNTGGLPTISTLSSSSITSNSAFLSGNLSNTGSSAIISKGFCYSTSANPTVSNNVVNVSGGSLGNFSTTINGLSSNTVYYFRAFATNSSGVAYGNIMQFQTSNTVQQQPTVLTLGSSSITSNSAFLSGNLSNAGSSSIISKGFCYSTSANPTVSNNVVNVSGGSLGNFSTTINGLSSNTVYYFRAFATNSSGVAYGAVFSFLTPSLLALGDYYQGGIIGYIYQPGDQGYVQNEVHGIIVAVDDQVGYTGGFNMGVDYSIVNNQYYGANLSGLGNAGQQNTTLLVNSIGSGSYAAKICSDLVLNGYNDWYLPTTNECQKIKLSQNQNNINFTGGLYHWTSTELNASNAYQFDFIGMVLNPYSVTKTTNGYVRAVRRF